MWILVLLFLLFLSGSGLSVQAAINANLGKTVGVVGASFISSFVSSVALLIIGLFFWKGSMGNLLSIPKWQYLGGLLRAIYIATIAFSVTKVSVQLAVISAVFGQMVMSALIDHFGLFQIQSNPVNIQRIFGLILLFIAMILIYRGSIETT